MIGKNDIRNSLKIMRDIKRGIPVQESESPVNENRGMDMRSMLGRMRKMKEANEMGEKTLTPLDVKREQEKIQKAFEDLEVSPTINDLQAFDNGVFMSGSIDRSITFTFSVTSSENNSGVEWTATNEFDSESEENQEVIRRLEAYYKEFYNYWRDNELHM